MANAYKNKVVYGGRTLIDLTDATATAADILEGKTAYGATGEKLVGTYGHMDVNPILEENTWEVISQISIAGTGDTYWDVGDRKSIVLNGTVGRLELSNVTLCVFILDFNHPIDKITADNNIIWGGFKTADGIDVALCDSGYGSNYSGGFKYYNLNHRGDTSTPYNTNYGGWKGCDLRYDILGGTSTKPSGYSSTPTTSRVGYDATEATISTPVSNTLMAALPEDLRSVLRLWTRYIDSKGGGANTSDNVTATLDAITLLAEFEITGVRKYANTYEQYHQKQMAYYAAGNEKIKYKHSDTDTTVIWWVASPVSTNSVNGLTVSGAGSISTSATRTSRGVAPAFKT